MMKKRILNLTFASIFLFGVSTVSAQTLKQLIATPTEYASPITAQASSSFTASYDIPVGLRNIGTITASNSAVCSYLMRHKAINGGALLWAPKEREVTYFNSSTGDDIASSLWQSDGGTIKNPNDNDGKVLYETSGIYSMPTLKVTASSGDSKSYTAPYTIKAGGTAELALADTREWMTTYYWGASQYADGGFLGGTNSQGIVGCGNLFMIGQDDAYLTGVNVYLYKKPTKYAANAKVSVRVWMPLITESQMTLAYIPLEGEYINMSDFKDGSDNEWAPVEGGAAGHVVFSEPIDLYGKPYFFISVEGFSNDPSTEDFVMLQDLMGKNLTETEAASLLSHNSFVRMSNEDDYTHPISQVGGGTGSFLICPMVKTDNTDSSVSSIGVGNKAMSVAVSGNVMTVNTDINGALDVYSISGLNMLHSALQIGENNISLDDLNPGVYLIKTSNGESFKFYKH